MKPKGIDFVAYTVTDMDRAEAFYRDVLGLEISQPRGEPGTRGNGYMEFECGGVSIGLTQMEPMPNAAMALAVEDVATAIADLKAQGVTIGMEPIETGDCVIASIADPDGNQIIIHRRHDGTYGHGG